MRITQGTFSFLPDFTDEQIEAQMRYAVGNGQGLCKSCHNSKTGREGRARHE